MQLPQITPTKATLSRKHLYTGKEIMERKAEEEAEAKKKLVVKEQKKKKSEEKKKAAQLKKDAIAEAKRKKEQEKQLKQQPPPKKRRLNNKNPKISTSPVPQTSNNMCLGCRKSFKIFHQQRKNGQYCCCCGKIWCCSTCFTSNLNGAQDKLRKHELDCENK